MPGFVVALIGAAGTGKTTLAAQLRQALANQGTQAVVIDAPTQPGVSANLTLLLALDLPTTPPRADEALQRQSADAALRQALIDAGCAFSVIAGHGPERLRAALAAIAAARRTPAPLDAAAPRWKHLCARCGDPDCERHRLPGA